MLFESTSLKKKKKKKKKKNRPHHTSQRAREHRGVPAVGRVGRRDLCRRLVLHRRHRRAGAEKFPRVRVEQREYLGAASQKNYAIDRAPHDWIFVIDADERVTPKLREEILRTLEGGPNSGPIPSGASTTCSASQCASADCSAIASRASSIADTPAIRTSACTPISLVDGETGRLRAQDGPLLHPHVRSHDREDDALRELGGGADVHRRQDDRAAAASSATPSASSSATTSSTSASSTARAA